MQALPAGSCMSNTHRLIKGTIILTGAGFLCRFLGFFYRIYLSRQFTEENIGIYQLLTPLCALVFAITSAGLQTAISKFVAATSQNDQNKAVRILTAGGTASLSLALILMFPLYCCSDKIAVLFLKEARTAPLIRLFALSIPFAGIHACINGFFYGFQKTGLPALSQLLEQCIRILTLTVLCESILRQSMTPLIQVAAVGMITSEAASALLSLFYLYRYIMKHRIPVCFPDTKEFVAIIKELFGMAWPLTASRIVITLLLGLEASYLPEMIMRFGGSRADALGAYGIMTGMALPLILFPSAITNSISVLLLPMISEAEEQHKNNTIVAATRRSIKYCCLWGSICFLGFYFLGPPVAGLLFDNTDAGAYVRSLSFICPFLYLSSTTGSILHGLGRTRITFISQLASLAVRLAFVFLLIPGFGINAYFSGLLTSELVLCMCYLLALRKYMYYT